ncbi:MAG: PilZ domain-containing protein [Betaproteobacteria bacterium]|nr:PilZ domain-containing protein [Betaproteobacteria bacterium]
MSERRAAPRQKSFLRGCIYFNNRRAAADCLIRDISEQGARLIFSSAVAIPDVVDLYVPQKEQTLRVHVQWRHGEEVGVAFAPAVQALEASAAAGSGDLPERMQKLEAEVAALRRIVRRLLAAVPAAGTDAA